MSNCVGSSGLGLPAATGEGDAKTPPALSFQPSMRTSTRRMIADIEKFFQRYAIAAEARGVEALASFHHAPFLHIHGDGRVECLPTHEAVHEFFLVLFGKYAERDHGGGRFLDLPPMVAASRAVRLVEALRHDALHVEEAAAAAEKRLPLF